jgi:hydroxyethylthiazole kinase-like uncharacterized protein yjeF
MTRDLPALLQKPLYRTASLREIESRAMAAPLEPSLMERAGAAAAALAEDMLAATGGRIRIHAGPGNNGGDALVVARRLRERFHAVDLVLHADPARLPADATAALAAWTAAGGHCQSPSAALPRPCLVIDGLFGIGLRRPPEGELARAVREVGAPGAPVLSLDVPSGLDADTGAVPGCAVRATRTIAFIADKPGLHTGLGPDHAGTVEVAPLGVDARSLREPDGWRIVPGRLDRLLLPRARSAHKGTAGSVGVLGGAPGMVGAALLAARAALLCGAGRVSVGLVDERGCAVDPLQPELMLRPWHELPRSGHLDVLAAGPGLGEWPESFVALEWAAGAALPLVLDADALTLLAAHPALAETVARRASPTVLTPHPGEAARLLGVDVAAIQSDRIGAAQALAARFRCPVVIKGAGSVTACAEGRRWAVHTAGNPGMASAGMGDTLTGIVASLLAQGLPADCALESGVTLHAAAGDAASAARGASEGLRGLTASEVSRAARALLAGVPVDRS